MSEEIKASSSSFDASSDIPSDRFFEGRFLCYWLWRTLLYEYLTLRRAPFAQKDLHELAKLRKQIFLTYLKNFLWFPLLFLKLLVPSYMKGEVNVWTNLRALWQTLTSREFRPLRMAVLMQFVFLYVVGHLGYIVFHNYAAPAYAATYTWIQNSWAGNASTTATGIHPTNQTDFTYYHSASSTITASSSIALLPVESSVTQTSDVDFTGGTLSQVIIDGLGDSAVLRLTGGVEDVNNWDSPVLTSLPVTAGADAMMIRNGSENTIYVLRGSGTGFYGYSISDNSWTELASLPGAVGVGAKMLRTGSENFIYVLAAGGTTNFYRYSISGNSWTTLTGPSGTINDGPNMVRYGDHIYVLRGGISSAFYYYSISGGTWATRDTMTTTPGTGSQMITNGTDGYIYATRGTAGVAFYRFSVSGNSWSTMASVPAIPGDGSQMIRNASNDQIYLLRGGGTQDFYRYSVAGNSWTPLTNTPGAIGTGAQMIRNGSDDYIYVLRGGSQTSFFRYSIAGNSWTTLFAGGTIGAGAQMIRNGSDNEIYVLQGGGSAGFNQYIFQREEYDTPGIHTSSPLDMGFHAGYTTLTFTTSSLSATTVTIDARSGDTSTPDETWTEWQTNVLDGGSISTLSNNRYFQYRVNLATSNVGITPSFSDISIFYNHYTSGSLISSPYNSDDAGNLLASISWDASTPVSITVKFQVRTSPDNSSYTSWMGPDGTVSTYFTDFTGAQDMPETVGDGVDDRWMQYRMVLESEGADTPILDSATVTYVVNAPPEIFVTSTPVFQSSEGLVEVTYEVRDFDTLTGSTPGTVAIDLQYCTSNCSSVGNEVWETAASSSLAGSYGLGIVVDAENYTEYSLTWDPTISLASHYNGSDFKIRIRANDSEAANNYAYDESNTFILDTTDPVVNSFVIDARSDANPSLTLSVTDNTPAGLLMKLSNNSDLSPDGLNDDSGTWVPYTATSSWVFASGPTSTVYYSISDAYGNLSSGDAVSSALSPLTPINMVIRDISNSEMSEWWEFIAWGVVPEPSAGFKQYTIYRSTDGSNYSLLATQTDRTINYYFDQNLNTETMYYYKVVAEDNNNNISKYSSVVSDVPNGQGGSDETAPTISSVSSTSIGTESVTIAWDTDELSDSIVDYMTDTGGDFSTAESIGLTAMVDSSSGLGQHAVTISGLTPATTYYYRVRSRDPQSNEGVRIQNPDGYTFTTLAGPSITDVAISHISNTGATITWATDQSSDSYVYYSTSTNFTSPVLVGLANSVQQHEVTLGSLSPGITYYFFVQSGVGQDKNVVEGEIRYYVFTTTMDVSAPVISFDADADVSVTEDSITVSWTTDEIATSTIEYGTSDQYGTISINNNYNTNHFSVISDLLGGTLYYFRLYVTDENDNRSIATEFVATTTDSLDITPPFISDVEITVVTDDDALIVWDTDEAATGQVYYGTATTLYTVSSSVISTYNRAHAITLSGLTTSTLYYYIVVSLDPTGNSTTSSEYTFTTLETLSEESEVALREETARAEGVVQGSSSVSSRGGGGGGGSSVDRTAPIISAATVDEISGSRVSVLWTANEASVGIMEFGTTPDDYTKSAVTMPLTFKTDHRISLQDLDPLTTYYYRVTAADASFNVSNPLTGSFTTLSPLEDLDALVSSTENTVISEETEEVFLSSIEKASELIRSLSTRVGVRALEATLTDQAAFIQELSALLPLPIIGGQPLVEVGSNYARVSWTTDKFSNSLVKFAPEDVFETLGSDYDQTVGDAATMVLNHRVEIKNLLPNTLYHYRVISRTIAGAETVSADFTFRTAAEVTEISTYKFDVISANEARIMWVTSAPTDSSVAFTPYRGGVPDLDSKQFVKDASFVTQHSLTLSELEAGVVYDVELSGVDYGGNTVREVIQGFSTTDTDLPPIISQIQTDSAIIPGSTEKIQTIISWNTNELSTSRVYYRKGFATNESPFTDMTTLDLGYVKKHIVVVSNFESGQVYQFAVESTDSSGNTALSNTITILTPRKEESVFQVIMSNIEDLFSWVGKVRR